MSLNQTDEKLHWGNLLFLKRHIIYYILLWINTGSVKTEPFN